MPPPSLAQVYLHIVFSTKGRAPFLRDPDLRQRTHAYLAGACNNLGLSVLKVGGVEDHVHIACRFPRTTTIADGMRDLKRDSAKWLKKREPSLGDFQWQEGYGVFSVSPSHLPALLEYVANQERHHRKESYQDELRRILAKYEVEYDERYLWD